MTNEGQVFRAVTVSGLQQVARQVVKELGNFNVWLFYGEMGSGKTTLVKAICKVAGVKGTMSSPTYAIVNEYEASEYTKIFHFDFYRLKHEAEAFDIGTDEYLDSGYPCFVEWPEKIPSLIPSRYGKVMIRVEDQNLRTIGITFHDGKEENGV